MPGRKEMPIVAIMYDFDKTLCTKDMQEYNFIPSIGESAESFWTEVSAISKKEKMDPILTYMYQMIRKSKDKHKQISKNVFKNAGKGIKLFPGVEEWFDNINKYGAQQGVRIEHYIISSGLKEIIEGSSIYNEFKEVYACEFHYDENGLADWPKVAVNYTNKTQFLYRINKGCLDLSDNEHLNKSVKEDDRRIPFRNMIYIGDGMTDVPCMKLVKVNGGVSIAVYQSKKTKTVEQLMRDNRVDYIEKANYKCGSELDILIKNIILKMATVSLLVKEQKRQEKNLTNIVEKLS